MGEQRLKVHTVNPIGKGGVDIIAEVYFRPETADGTALPGELLHLGEDERLYRVSNTLNWRSAKGYIPLDKVCAMTGWLLLENFDVSTEEGKDFVLYHSKVHYRHDDDPIVNPGFGGTGLDEAVSEKVLSIEHYVRSNVGTD